MQKALERNGEEGESMKKRADQHLRKMVPLGEDLAKDEVTRILDETEASIVASLSNLRRLWEKGEPNAVQMIAEFGVLCSGLLEQGSLSTKVPAAKAYGDAVRSSFEWPVSCPAVVDRRESNIQKQIPSELGIERTVDRGKTTGKGGRRNFDPTSRTGFALTYQEDLEWGRQHAKKYPLYEAGLFARFSEQGEAAQSIISKPHLFKDPNGPLLSEEPNGLDSIADLMKTVDGVPDIDWNKLEEFCNNVLGSWDDEGLSGEMATVGPECIQEIWEQVVMLPEFSEETIEQWISLSIKLAETRCGGEWEKGPWKKDFRCQANRRTIVNGGNEGKAYAYVVKSMIKGGFRQLLKDATEKAENR